VWLELAGHAVAVGAGCAVDELGHDLAPWGAPVLPAPALVLAGLFAVGFF
jgi:hypothetical protein